jgi:hypothetical protein
VETLRPLANGRMTVEGVFHFEEGVGRYIDVTEWTAPPNETRGTGDRGQAVESGGRQGGAVDPYQLRRLAIPD